MSLSQNDHIRRTQALEAQLGRLNSQFRKVKGRVSGIQTGILLNEIPSWDVVRQETGTFDPGTDWESQFNAENMVNRVQHSMRTAGGEISHVNCDLSAVRLRIRFTSQGSGELQAKLSMVGGDTTNRVQVKVNGKAVEYAAGGWIPIKQVPPPMTNEVIVMANGTDLDSFQISLDGLLFDGIYRKWVSY